MTAFLNKIIAPYSIDDFFNKYHEKEILHIDRNDPHYYTSILTAAEISDFLDRQDVFYPSLRIVKNGKEIPSGEYTLKSVPIGHHRRDGIIHTEKAFSLFNQGSTFVIQAGQRYFENLSKCCMALSQKFNAPVQANLYITPQKSQGFNPHWDTHDVFVLQIAGTKTWQLYGFEKELPTKNQGFVSKGYEKEPVRTLQLCPGDFLYLPRGYVHDAMADDGISAHITVGILSFTWARLFADTLTQLENEKTFREAVPFWKENLPALIREKVEALKVAIDHFDYNQGIQKLNEQYYKTQPQPVNHYFESLLALPAIDNKSRFAVNKNVIYQQEETEDRFILKCFGKQLALSLQQKQLIHDIFSREAFTLADLTENIGMEHKKTLIAQLIREGVVYIVRS